ncbi:MAG: type II secretion system protein [Phycisphaerae bacterium]
MLFCRPQQLWLRVRPAKPARSPNAFTLIEILVVVSVVATLAAAILPSFRAAREKARTVVCAAHTAAIGRAAATYSTESTGWLCGSPGTSGSIMYSRTPEPLPAEEDIPTDPMQNWDYAGALAPTYMNISLPANRALRMKQVIIEVFACPSNHYYADPVAGERASDGGPIGTFDRQPMVSYNTFRNFLLWPRTMVNRDPTRPWGPRAPNPQASFDTIGGNTIRPKNYRPHIDKIINPAAKAYLADGNRFTDEEARITYDMEWNAKAGGAFANGGPTLHNGHTVSGHPILSSYHYEKERGRPAYRHHASRNPGIVVNFFDSHSEFMAEAQSREPDTWWPKGTIIPFSEFNEPSQRLIAPRIDPMSPYYLVNR